MGSSAAIAAGIAAAENNADAWQVSDMFMVIDYANAVLSLQASWNEVLQDKEADVIAATMSHPATPALVEQANEEYQTAGTQRNIVLSQAQLMVDNEGQAVQQVSSAMSNIYESADSTSQELKLLTHAIAMGI